MFEPVVHELTRSGATSMMLSLDRYYAQGATERLRASGIAVCELAGLERSTEGFYDRTLIAVWRDALRARATAGRLLARLKPRVLVLGNDRGLVEKALISAARRAAAATVLVQDGVLARRRPAAETALESAKRALRAAASAVLVRTPLSFLAVSEYGEAGCEVICVTGHRYRDLLLERSVWPSRVRVTGQPRYESLRELAEVAGQRGNVVFFTTPLRAARLGEQAHRRQIVLARELATALAAAGRRLTVKPHPRDAASDYAAIMPAGRISSAPVRDALRDADVVVAGISTVVEEAGIARRPVIVPGRVVHDRRFAEHLPDPAAYPRFESAEAAVRLIELLDDPLVRERQLAHQAADVADRVELSPTRTAAQRVADEIVALLVPS